MKQERQGNASILVVILLVIVLGAAGFYLIQKGNLTQNAPISQPTSSASPSTKVYTNSKYGFQITYPNTLSIREMSDQSGAALRPSDKAEDPQNDVIDISVLPKIGDMANQPLSEYAKVAAHEEIQGYKKLVSITAVTAQNGVIGYETTWEVSPPPAIGVYIKPSNEPSLPRTYFDLPGYPGYTAQISLSDSTYLSQYEQILKSFSVK